MPFDPEGNEARQVYRLAHLPSDARVLEIGCADGRLTWHYADSVRSVVGIDPVTKWLNEAVRDCPDRLRHKVTFVRAIVEGLPFPPEAFDLAIFARSL